MATYITLADVQIFRPDIDVARTSALILSAEAQALEEAPCIADATFLANTTKMQVLLGILRGAILRWDDIGNGDQNLTARNQAVGPFIVGETIDTRKPGGYSLWPSESDRIRRLCGSDSAKAFAINTAPAGGPSPHADICALNFGATYCSCGAVLTNLLYPLYEREGY